jgi:transcription elongation factor GreA
VEREVILTEEGYAKLQDEIEYLTTTKRREVADRIKTAREFGDISENSEYDDAKNEQAHVESRILQIEHQLRNARIVDTHDVATDVVGIGTKVTVRTTADKKTKSFALVGSAEADPVNDRLSNESPIGKALMGRKKGDKVNVATPRGQVEYQVVKIEAED